MSDIILSSAIGQLCSQVVIWPSEVLKIQKQIYPNIPIHRIAVSTYRDHGLRGFTTGFCPAALANIPRIISHFYFYDMFQKQYGWHHIPSAFASGSIAALASTPLYNMTTRKVYDMSSVSSSSWNMRYAYNGFRALLAKNCLEVSATFWLYGQLGQFESIPYIIVGGLASATSCILTNPIDVVNTTLQTDYDKTHNRSMISAFNHIQKRYGISGLYAGCGTRMMRAFPGGAVRYYMFRYVMDYFEKTRANTSARC